MDQHALINLLLFISFFLGLASLIQHFSLKTTFPYTVALLLIGFVSQFVTHALHLDLHLTLPPEIIYFVLLPILLFEASMHINFHQFRLQFKTITFLSTFGLVVSIAIVGGGLAYLLGMPLSVALLFGALISATDPIAVLALFKTLGAPRRLSLLADGESMLNDATAVIAFRLLSGFVIANNAFGTDTIFHGVNDFLYIFLGSMVFGLIFGYLSSLVVEKVRNDRVLVSVLTVAVAFGSFVGAEHFFHLSGVIATVMAGITLGNLGQTKIAGHVKHAVEEMWETFGFIAVSLVFFFASYGIELSIFTQEIYRLVVVVAVLLVARAVSVYVSSYLTNVLPIFNDEPNVPMSWQHILNWGGLRGVIPLVLAYSLPDSFMYKEELVAFTLVCLVFTLIVNGLTIKPLLIKLGLHLKKKEEEIISQEDKLFSLEESKRKLNQLTKDEFNSDVVSSMIKELNTEEKKVRAKLLSLAGSDELLQSLKIQGLNIERETIQTLFESGHINENVYYQFDIELDLQQDALEYPEMFATRVIDKEGVIHSRDSYRARIRRLRDYVIAFPLLRGFFKKTENREVADRYSLLRARIISSERVTEYLDKVGSLINTKAGKKAIAQVRVQHEKLIKENKAEIASIEKQYSKVVANYQRGVLDGLLAAHH